MITLKHPNNNQWSMAFSLGSGVVVTTKNYKARSSAVKCLRALRAQADAGKWLSTISDKVAEVKSPNGMEILTITNKDGAKILEDLRAMLVVTNDYDYLGNQVTYHTAEAANTKETITNE